MSRIVIISLVFASQLVCCGKSKSPESSSSEDSVFDSLKMKGKKFSASPDFIEAFGAQQRNENKLSSLCSRCCKPCKEKKSELLLSLKFILYLCIQMYLDTDPIRITPVSLRRLIKRKKGKMNGTERLFFSYLSEAFLPEAQDELPDTFQKLIAMQHLNEMLIECDDENKIVRLTWQDCIVLKKCSIETRQRVFDYIMAEETGKRKLLHTDKYTEIFKIKPLMIVHNNIDSWAERLMH